MMRLALNRFMAALCRRVLCFNVQIYYILMSAASSVLFVTSHCFIFDKNEEQLKDNGAPIFRKSKKRLYYGLLSIHQLKSVAVAATDKKRNLHTLLDKPVAWLIPVRTDMKKNHLQVFFKKCY